MNRPRPNRFPVGRRIKSKQTFDQVFSRGKAAADASLVVHAVRTPDSQTRLGLSISKRVGNAPRRNYWKRLIREAFRTQQQDLPSNLALVVRPKRGSVPDANAIRRSLKRLAWKLNKKLPSQPTDDLRPEQ